MVKFWKAVDEGLTYEEAAFKTFTGNWAKEIGFQKAVFDPRYKPNEDLVIVKLIN